jgi:hypothetical protein
MQQLDEHPKKCDADENALPSPQLLGQNEIASAKRAVV